MKRSNYFVTLTNTEGDVVAKTQKYAMNSGVRASEALLLLLAREKSTTYSGSNPRRVADVYTRIWISTEGSVITARIEKI